MARTRSRREFLRVAAGSAGVLVLGGAAVGCSTGQVGPTAAEFLANRRFHVAHRGSGDEAPEHTLSAYRNVVEHGCEAVEVSVRRTRDGVLVCHHDETLARTCNGAPGTIGAMDFGAVSAARVDMTRLVGPAWKPEPIPRLDTVLDRLGGRAVLFVEPKDWQAAGDVLAAVTDRGLQERTVYKQFYKSSGDAAAREAGLAVWNYLDDETDVAVVPDVAQRSDAIGVRADDEPLSDKQTALVIAAVATGTPVIAWAVHRRHQVETLAALGVRGFMSSSWTYLAQRPMPAAADDFRSGRITPGDLSFDYSPEAAPTWNDDGSIGLANTAAQQSLSMGSMCPITVSPYRLSLSMAFDGLPPDPRDHAGVAFGRPTDAAYGFRRPGPSSGFLVILRANGRIELRRIPPDNGESEAVTSVEGEPVVPGRWEKIDITVGPDEVTVRRTPTGGEQRVIRANVRTAGTYFSLTRNYPGRGAAVRFRDVRVTSP